MRINRVGLKVSLLSSILVLAVIVAIGRLTFQYIEQALVSEMQVRAAFFARSLREGFVPKVDPFALHFQVQQMGKEKAVVYAGVLDTSGKFLSHSEARLIGELDNTTVGRQSLGALETLVQTYRRDGRDFFDIAVPIFASDQRVGTARLGFTRESIQDALKGARERIVLIGVAATAVAVLGTVMLVGWMLRALTLLAAAAESVGDGNLDVSVNWSSRDEIGTLAQSFNHMVQGLREREKIRDVFGKYVSPQIAQAALQGRIALGGERRTVSVLLSDIRDFTKLSEGLSPEQVVAVLNVYLARMVKVIVAHGGHVDKFIGDAILAVFGAPLAVPDHAARAAAAAVAMSQELFRMNAESRARGGGELRIGIAVHTGDAVAGNIGSVEKMEYTVIGDTVNMVSRMESVNKFFGSQVLASDATMAGASGVVEARAMGSVQVPGKEVPIKLFELLGAKDQLADPWPEAKFQYDIAMAQFGRKEWATARDTFDKVLKVLPNDGPAAFYRDVCNDYSVIPPPDDWPGVFKITGK